MVGITNHTGGLVVATLKNISRNDPPSMGSLPRNSHDHFLGCITELLTIAVNFTFIIPVFWTLIKGSN